MRSNWPRLVELAVPVLMMSGVAHAQLLDLSGPGVPGPGDGRAALRLARSLGNRVDIFYGEGSERSRAKAAWRNLARRLLVYAEQAGPEASTIALTARTLASHGDELDGLIERADHDSAWMSAVVFERLDVADFADQRALDTAVRDGIAPLLATSASAAPLGWFAEHLESADVSALLSADSELGRLLFEVETHRAYAQSVSRIGLLLNEAAGILESPAWLSPEASDRLGDSWRMSIRGLSSAETHSWAIARLERLAALNGLFACLEGGSRDTSLLSARRAVDAAIVSSPAMLEAGEELTGALRLVASLLDDAGLHRLESGLASPLRPVWKHVELRRLDACRRQMLDLPRILDSPRPLTDPAVLSRLDACRRSASALRGLSSLSRILTGESVFENGPGRPKVDRRYQPVADRLIDLARRLDREDDTDLPSAILQSLVDWSARHGEWPGEPDLRLGGPLAEEMARIAGTDLPTLIDEIDRARSAWLNAWVQAGAPRELDSINAWMDKWRSTMSLLSGSAALAPASRGERRLLAVDWPGFELSDDAFRYLTEGFEIEARLSWDETISRKLSSRTGRALDKFAPALLVAALEGVVTARRSVPAPARGIDELVAGAPIESLCWGVRGRETIALVCRYAEEAAAGEDWMLPYVRARALEALEEIGSL